MESDQAPETSTTATIRQHNSRKVGRRKKQPNEMNAETIATANNLQIEGDSEVSSSAKSNKNRGRRRPKANQKNGTAIKGGAGEEVNAPVEPKENGTSEKKRKNKRSIKKKNQGGKDNEEPTNGVLETKGGSQKYGRKLANKSESGEEVDGQTVIMKSEKRNEKSRKNRKSPKKNQKGNKRDNGNEYVQENIEDNQGKMQGNGRRKSKSKNSSKKNEATKAATKSENSNSARKKIYEEHISSEEALKLYNERKLLRGKLRCLPGNKLAFVACDRGDFSVDIVIMSEKDRNRALDGNVVYVEIVEVDGADADLAAAGHSDADVSVDEIEINLEDLKIDDNDDDDDGDVADHDAQNQLWSPVIEFRQRKESLSATTSKDQIQKQGRVVHVMAQNDATTIRTIIGRLVPGKHNDDIVLLAPVNRKLPVFLSVDFRASRKFKNSHKRSSSNEKGPPPLLYRAEYTHDTWGVHHRFPPCGNVQAIGESYDPESETQALLLEHNIDYTDQFSDEVMEDVYNAVGTEQKVR